MVLGTVVRIFERKLLFPRRCPDHRRIELGAPLGAAGVGGKIVVDGHELEFSEPGGYREGKVLETVGRRVEEFVCPAVELVEGG